jgi:hypothetical protein
MVSPTMAPAAVSRPAPVNRIERSAKKAYVAAHPAVVCCDGRHIRPAGAPGYARIVAATLPSTVPALRRPELDTPCILIEGDWHMAVLDRPQIRERARPVPLRERRGDLVVLLFFTINLCFITYMVDLEQLVIANPARFSYPIWPPGFVVDMVHHYGHTYDPLVLARPIWWKMTIWIDSLYFGPFYAVAIYAFVRGREWIRIPSIIYASVLMTNVIIILSEELFGPHATPQLPIVLLANAPWLLMPIYIIYRMWRYTHPFTAPAPKAHALPQPQPA